MYIEGRLYQVSVLFYEPKLLKSVPSLRFAVIAAGFSALLRAEIVEIEYVRLVARGGLCFSALLRAEIVEMRYGLNTTEYEVRFQCSSTSRNC